ncbi:MAG: hypothetical protein JOZ81_06685 [Chloroflexi bacterium]|nr:hypothetical protein [Chloroflexota bacterium]
MKAKREPRLTTMDAMLDRLNQWRHAALCLLDHYITGRPLNFRGREIPQEVANLLAEHHARQERNPRDPT